MYEFMDNTLRVWSKILFFLKNNSNKLVVIKLKHELIIVNFEVVIFEGKKGSHLIFII